MTKKRYLHLKMTPNPRRSEDQHKTDSDSRQIDKNLENKQGDQDSLHKLESKSRKKDAVYEKDSKPLNKNYSHARRKNIEIGGEFTLIEDVIPPEKTKVGRVLPHWLLHPIPVRGDLQEISKSPKETCPLLHNKLVEKLKENNIHYLFPVQQTVIPEVLSGASGVETWFRPRDICVATPTGSGKTLAFVLPIVQTLCGRTIPAIRALVILPVVELANQVYKVFCTYAAVFGLKVGHMFGKDPIIFEQKNLIQRVYRRYQSNVDILVATPGRLMIHIQNTPGLDFSQLRFLVFDEADRLLSGGDGELIGRIHRYMMQCKGDEVNNLCLPPWLRSQGAEQNVTESRSFEVSKKTDEVVLSPMKAVLKENVHPRYCSQPFEKDFIKLEVGEGNPLRTKYPSSRFLPPLQRLLFSATLTLDPERLQNVTLYRPMLFTTSLASDNGIPTVVQRPSNQLLVVRPSELAEVWVKTDSELKLLTAHYLLRKEAKRCGRFKVLVFTSSLELTSKVAHMLRAMSKGRYSVEEFSAKLNCRRKIVFGRFLKGTTNVLVSSDAMARGIDVPNVDCVMSYDVPSASMYVHRIGRTARAGKPGKAITFVTDEDFKDFKKIAGENFENMSEVQVKRKKLVKFESSFQSALVSLSEAMESYGKKGRLIPKILKRRTNVVAGKRRPS